jgi:hypothetical protein
MNFTTPFEQRKWLFGNVAAGEVHPQPHISVFDKAKKKDFAW